MLKHIDAVKNEPQNMYEKQKKYYENVDKMMDNYNKMPQRNLLRTDADDLDTQIP